MRVYIRDDGQRLEVSLIFRRPLALIKITQLFKSWRKQRNERTPGLHIGAYHVRDDFDDPLSEDFLIASS